MSLNLIKDTGTPLEKQGFTWRELVQTPTSKLDCDAFTRVRIILMNGIEHEALRFSHACARMNQDLRVPLAMVRRVEQHQATMVNWLLPPDMSPLEITIAYEQVAIEVTASVAQSEPDPYLAQVYRFGLLEDFDHLYRYSALLDRLEGKDANNILQSYTDIVPGRPTSQEHRHPADDLRAPFDKNRADLISKLHALTILSGEQQTHNFYMNVGPSYADPMARLLYAEIASIEEQHMTQYESIIDPNQTWLEQWLMHEANEVYNYYSCLESETEPRVRAIWERFLDYELGHLATVREIFKNVEKRDPEEVLTAKLPKPIAYVSHREFVRETLLQEVGLRANGADFVPEMEEPERSLHYRDHLNSELMPTEIVARGYRWSPGGELTRTDIRQGFMQ
ncbi:MAG: hypothetical protein AB7G93_09360 [Bdellovibrionales bacterium]